MIAFALSLTVSLAQVGVDLLHTHSNRQKNKYNQENYRKVASPSVHSNAVDLIGPIHRSSDHLCPSKHTHKITHL